MTSASSSALQFKAYLLCDYCKQKQKRKYTRILSHIGNHIDPSRKLTFKDTAQKKAFR